MKINLKGHWGQARHLDILAVLNDAALALTPHFDSRPTAITVKPGDGLPIALFGTEGVIRLTVRERFWCQYAYQFGHELCHLLTNHNRLQNTPGGHFQVDEIICEAAAIFTVFKLGERWNTNPPYPHWAPFALEFQSYGRGVLAEYSAKPSGPIYAAPQNDAVDRNKNGYVAAKLLKLFWEHPEYWKATQSLPLPTPTVTEFFENWRRVCPEPQAVEALIAVLAVEE